MTPFTKRRPSAAAGFFDVEAAGLRWLAAVPDGARVAQVLEVTASSITLQDIANAAPTPVAAEAFGAALVRTHDAGAAAFGSGPDGWSGDGYIGDAPLSLRPQPRWGEFYAEQRVLPYARAALDAGDLTSADLGAIEQLCRRLTDGEFDDGAPPARLHGDLWSGNVLYSPDGVVLIDPAAQGGHRITDLAMLSLFGAPHLGVVLEAYESASRWLPADWRGLVPLHQLHPLLVHLVLFGSSYRAQAMAAVRRYS